MPANPEAIAWYVRRSEALLEESHRSLRSLRTRGVQLAGFSGAVLALAGANAESILTALHGIPRYGAGTALIFGATLLVAAFVLSLAPRASLDLSGVEAVNYTSSRFIEEPALWRVQVRTIRGLSESIELTATQGNTAAKAIGAAERLLSGGLLAVGTAVVILMVEVTFR